MYFSFLVSKWHHGTPTGWGGGGRYEILDRIFMGGLLLRQLARWGTLPYQCEVKISWEEPHLRAVTYTWLEVGQLHTQMTYNGSSKFPLLLK